MQEFASIQLRKDLIAAEDTVKSIKAAISRAESDHQHKWEAIKYVPIEHQAYRTAGDPPGTMGIDWQGPMYVEGSTEKRWSRSCIICGKEQFTTRTKRERMSGTVPGTSGEVEVPDFGDTRYW